MLDSEVTRPALCDGPKTAAFLVALATTAEDAANDFQNAFWNARMGRGQWAGGPAAGSALITCSRAALFALSGAEEQVVLAAAGGLPPAQCSAQSSGVPHRIAVQCAHV